MALGRRRLQTPGDPEMVLKSAGGSRCGLGYAP